MPAEDKRREEPPLPLLPLLLPPLVVPESSRELMQVAAVAPRRTNRGSDGAGDVTSSTS